VSRASVSAGRDFVETRDELTLAGRRVRHAAADTRRKTAGRKVLARTYDQVRQPQAARGVRHRQRWRNRHGQNPRARPRYALAEVNALGEGGLGHPRLHLTHPAVVRASGN